MTNQHDHSNHDASAGDAEPERIAGLDGLDLRRAPARDLWPEIQARIAQTAAPRRVAPVRRRWLPLAAAASLTAVIAGLIGVEQLRGSPAPATVASVSSPMTAPEQTASLQESSMPALQGANRALVKANLKIVKGAEDQLRQALAANPDDPHLQNLLLSTQTQQQHLRGLLDRNLT